MVLIHAQYLQLLLRSHQRRARIVLRVLRNLQLTLRNRALAIQQLVRGPAYLRSGARHSLLSDSCRTRSPHPRSAPPSPVAPCARCRRAPPAAPPRAPFASESTGISRDTSGYTAPVTSSVLRICVASTATSVNRSPPATRSRSPPPLSITCGLPGGASSASFAPLLALTARCRKAEVQDGKRNSHLFLQRPSTRHKPLPFIRVVATLT